MQLFTLAKSHFSLKSWRIFLVQKLKIKVNTTYNDIVIIVYSAVK